MPYFNVVFLAAVQKKNVRETLYRPKVPVWEPRTSHRRAGRWRDEDLFPGYAFCTINSPHADVLSPALLRFRLSFDAFIISQTEIDELVLQVGSLVDSKPECLIDEGVVSVPESPPVNPYAEGDVLFVRTGVMKDWSGMVVDVSDGFCTMALEEARTPIKIHHTLLAKL